MNNIGRYVHNRYNLIFIKIPSSLIEDVVFNKCIPAVGSLGPIELFAIGSSEFKYGTGCVYETDY